jgi:hypothetical protein
MSIGNRNGPTDKAHWTKIINVIAQIGSTVAGNLACGQPLPHYSALVLNAVQQLDAQLCRPGLDDGIDLLAHNEQWYPNRPQSLDAEAVGATDSNRFATVLRD